MSDKGKVEEKLSIRFEKEVVNQIDNLVKKGYFRSRSHFLRRAVNYFSHYLHLTGITRGKSYLIFGEKISEASESRLHNTLKDFGSALLENMGCNKIDVERTFLIEGKRFKVDVSGLIGDKKIAVECWVSSKGDEERLDKLATYFDDLIILTPEDVIEWYEQMIINYKEAFEKVSSAFGKPLLIYDTSRLPKIEPLKEKTTSIAGEQIPYDSIMKEFQKKKEVVIEDISEYVATKLENKLKKELSCEIRKEEVLNLPSGKSAWHFYVVKKQS